MKKLTIVILGIITIVAIALLTTMAIISIMLLVDSKRRSKEVKDPRIKSDYCQPDRCRLQNGEKDGDHIGCTHENIFDLTCIEPDLVPFSSKRIQVLLDIHNKLRNQIASGALAPYVAALRMPTLKWDDELAYLAELNVKQCELKHDQCRNTDSFPWAGQNLAYVRKMGHIDINDEIEKLVQSWFDEYKNATPAHIDKFPSEGNERISCFTGMVLDKCAFVGCGASLYIPHGKLGRTLLMACNYSYKNMINRRVYVAGTPMGSKCVTGTNTPKYPALCNENEAVDPDLE